jgi:hypothetical protein
MGKFYIISGKYRKIKNASSIESALNLAAKEMIDCTDGLGDVITINEHGYEGPYEDDVFFLTDHVLDKIEKHF